jgi:hypothetical protein
MMPGFPRIHYALSRKRLRQGKKRENSVFTKSHYASIEEPSKKLAFLISM